MPPSRGHVTKRKVASPEPDPDPVDDADTEGEEQEDEGSNPDVSNGNEEGAFSSTKKARVDINAVLKEYIQTFKVMTIGKNRVMKKRKKEAKVWSSAWRHCKACCPQQEAMSSPISSF